MDSVMRVDYIDNLDKIDYYKSEFVLMMFDEMNLVHNNQE
jgi:hypothetical protein